MNSGPPALEDLGQLTMAAQAHPAEAADLNLQHKEDMRLLQALAEYNYRALDAVPDPSATIMHARDEAHQWLAQLRDGQPSFLYSQRIGVQDKSAQARERADSGVLRERTDSGTQSAGLSRQRALRRHRKVRIACRWHWFVCLGLVSSSFRLPGGLLCSNYCNRIAIALSTF